MTNHTIPADVATLDGRRGSTNITLADDGLSYSCVRVFGAPPDRIFRAFTDPEDLRVWFPGGAPQGAEMPVCESHPVEGGRYHYTMVLPEYGAMAWHGRYIRVDRPHRIDAQEWFVMGDGEPEGEPSTQTLTFEAIGDGLTRMTMEVHMPEPEDPEAFMEQSAAGLGSSLAVLDELVTT